MPVAGQSPIAPAEQMFTIFRLVNNVLPGLYCALVRKKITLSVKEEPDDSEISVLVTARLVDETTGKGQKCAYRFTTKALWVMNSPEMPTKDVNNAFVAACSEDPPSVDLLQKEARFPGSSCFRALSDDAVVNAPIRRVPRPSPEEDSSVTLGSASYRDRFRLLHPRKTRSLQS